MSKTVLHVVKVYEGTYTDEALAALAKWKAARKAARHEEPRMEDLFNHPEGKIDLHIRDTTIEIALALLSYEPVVWNLHPSENQNISLIFIDSFHPSDVLGESVQTQILRRNYREKDKANLISEIEKDTGLEVTSFQESYKGKKFVI